jgi:hypothetical protein
MPLASPSSQNFVQSCLDRIEREFGISQAKVLCTALKVKRRLDATGAMPFGICTQYLPPDDGPYVPYQGRDMAVSQWSRRPGAAGEGIKLRLMS